MSDDPILAAIADLRRHLDNLRVDVVGRLEHMEDQITNLRSDVLVTMNATTTDAGRTAATRREIVDLGELVNGMMRQIARLRTDVDDLRNREPRG